MVASGRWAVGTVGEGVAERGSAMFVGDSRVLVARIGGSVDAAENIQICIIIPCDLTHHLV